MSIELPEAYILSQQMGRELLQKEVTSCKLQNCAELQKIGFINKNSMDFDRLRGGKIQSIVSRGNIIQLKFDNGMNMLLAPEYGGKILYTKESVVPSKFHLKVCFKDNTALTVTLTGMGIIQALNDEELKHSYVYKRDFSAKLSPMDNDEFSFEHFMNDLSRKNVNIKAALVGKNAVIVGLGNSSLQDILYRSKIHPKRKASELNASEKHALYDAIKFVVRERIRSGGKRQFLDIYGKQGNYTPAMGSNMKGRTCIACGAFVQTLGLGGGQTFYCPRCQK